MKRLGVVILATAALWIAFWWFSATSQRADIDAWLQDRRDEGWVAEVDGHRLGGFPLRIDSHLSGVTLADPGRGLAWSLPTLSLGTGLVWRRYVEIDWPETQTLSTPRRKLTITAPDLTTSLTALPDGVRDLMVFSLAGQNLTLDDSARGQTRIASVALDIQAVAAASYQTVLALSGIDLPEPARLNRSGKSALPRRLERIGVEGTATFDRPLNLRAVGGARPQPTRLDLRLAEARWGDLDMQMAGDLRVDPEGVPDGALTLKVSNWREVLGLVRQSGQVPDGMLDAAEGALDVLAQMLGNPNALDVELRFRRGRTYVGPLPVGDAPVLRLP